MKDALLCNKKAQRIDHCVIDVFMSVIHYMEGGESQPWWAFTEKRKLLLQTSTLHLNNQLKSQC